MAVEQLRELGALVKEEPYQNNVGYCERAQVPIEPRLSEQWFLKYPSVEKRARCVARQARMRFHPERWAKVYDHWMGGIQDWCISRQLWWGHRIPVWYRTIARRSERSDCDIMREPIAPRTPEELGRRIPTCSTPGFPPGSGRSPRWAGRRRPRRSPSSIRPPILVTGPDIIFFWVARMIMAGFEWMGELPFRNVYFTGIIRDKQGRKMSKSLGNSPDPLDLIAKFGADALRFGVMRSAPLGQDILFDEKNVELGRNFCTKLWNAARFRQMQGGEVEGEIDPALLTSDDKWILLRLDAAIGEVSQALDEYRFSDAAQALYRFFWSEYCDWYLEASKASLNGDDAARKANTLAVIDFVLGHALRLFHPFLPFITEELWHGLGYTAICRRIRGATRSCYAHWPQPLGDDFRAHYGLSEAEEKAAACEVRGGEQRARAAPRLQYRLEQARAFRAEAEHCTAGARGGSASPAPERRVARARSRMGRSARAPLPRSPRWASSSCRWMA